MARLAQELGEELGITLVGSEPRGVVSDQAALEQAPIEIEVYLARVAGQVTPRAERTQSTRAGSRTS